LAQFPAKKSNNGWVVVCSESLDWLKKITLRIEIKREKDAWKLPQPRPQGALSAAEASCTLKKKLAEAG